MGGYARPDRMQDVLALMASGPHRLLAGGTDVYPQAGAGLSGDVIDLAALPGLSGIVQGSGLRIGALTTWSDLCRAPLPPALLALQQAARQVGGRQIQNVATIGGNLCNASPAADGVPPLLVLDALVELQSASGHRTLPLADFIQGPRKTALRSGELLTAIVIPEASLNGGSAFVKLGARAYLVISIAMVAARVAVHEGKIASAAIAVGACAGTARRLTDVEAALIGASPQDVGEVVTEVSMARALAPIDDSRATADYRTTAAAELVRRAVLGAMA